MTHEQVQETLVMAAEMWAEGYKARPEEKLRVMIALETFRTGRYTEQAPPVREEQEETESKTKKNASKGS